jgi:hypothetical protein
MAQIDWNDFVIVETIDLYDDDVSMPMQNLAAIENKTNGSSKIEG